MTARGSAFALCVVVCLLLGPASLALAAPAPRSVALAPGADATTSDSPLSPHDAALVDVTSRPVAGSQQLVPDAITDAHRRVYLPITLRRPATAAVSPAQGSVYWGAAMDGVPWDMNRLAAWEGRAGKKASIIHFWQFWNINCTMEPFRKAPFANARAGGYIPMVTWPSERQGGPAAQPDFRLSEIIRGRYDAYIRQWAADARAWGHPFFLRYGHEMNGDWFPWSETNNGNAAGQFVLAWRHIRDLFRSAGATNVTWVWCPNFVYPSTTWPSLKSLYPGDDYVDWTCLDAYNWGPARPEGWTSFKDLFRYSYDSIRQFAPDKPMMIGEFASTEAGGSKPEWISDAFGAQIPQAFPQLKAVVWYNLRFDSQDWRLESTQAALDAFKARIASPVYTTNQFGGLATSPIPPLR